MSCPKVYANKSWVKQIAQGKAGSSLDVKRDGGGVDQMR